MNKKGIAMKFLVALIPLLVVTLILLWFIGGVGKSSSAQDVASVCRQSIEANAFSRIGGVPLYDDVRCPTEYRTVTSKEEEDILEQTANAMAGCWYKMGEGQYELFDPNQGVDTYCIICHVLEFDSADQEVVGLLNYMDEKRVPYVYAKGDIVSYTEYMQGFQSDPGLQLLYDQETRDSIDTNYDYATVFLYAKKGELHSIWSTIGGGLVGLGVGAVGGALIVGGVTAPAGFAMVGVVAGGAAGYALGGSSAASWESAVLLYPYTTDSLNELSCSFLPAQQ